MLNPFECLYDFIIIIREIKYRRNEKGKRLIIPRLGHAVVFSFVYTGTAYDLLVFFSKTIFKTEKNKNNQNLLALVPFIILPGINIVKSTSII